MKVTMELPNEQTPAAQMPASTARQTQSFSGTVKSPAQENNSEVPLINPVASAEQPNVTFRRDANGRIYYVVSDAQSGKEIEEVPPESVRDVAEGIEQYLKKGAAKPHTALNTKG